MKRNSRPEAKPEGRPRRRGGVLVMALLAAGLLCALVLSAATAVRLRWALADNTLRRSAARDEALSSITRALHLLAADTNALDSLEERWADPGETDGIQLSDEEARIHLPTASEGIVAALLVQEAGLSERQAQPLAQALIRWREAQPGPVPALELFARVPGLDAAVLMRIAPHATVHGHGRVNLNTTSESVLRILLAGAGASRETQSGMLTAFRAARRGGILCRTTDAQALAAMLVGPGRIPNPSEAQALAGIVPLLDVRSTAFRGVGVGTLPPAETPRHRIEFIYDRTKGAFLRWIE